MKCYEDIGNVVRFVSAVRLTGLRWMSYTLGIPVVGLASRVLKAARSGGMVRLKAYLV